MGGFLVSIRYWGVGRASVKIVENEWVIESENFFTSTSGSPSMAGIRGTGEGHVNLTSKLIS